LSVTEFLLYCKDEIKRRGGTDIAPEIGWCGCFVREFLSGPTTNVAVCYEYGQRMSADFEKAYRHLYRVAADGAVSFYIFTLPYKIPCTLYKTLIYIKLVTLFYLSQFFINNITKYV